MDNPLVQPDPGLFIWTILTFLVLVWALGKFAWRPLLAALEERQRTIQKSLDDAKQAQLELKRLQEQSAEIMATARSEAQDIVAKSRASAETVREDVKRKARAETEALVSNARQQIQQETTQALQEVRREAVDLSLAVASKLIKKNLTKEDNDNLIQESINQISTSQN